MPIMNKNSSENSRADMVNGTYDDLYTDLKAVFDNSYDVIYVSDGNGITLRVSSACERFWGEKPENLIGKNVRDLEKAGVFKPSITRLVLESKKKIQTLQVTQTGMRLMVVGTPIMDGNGKIIRVVNFSRDITQEEALEIELRQLKGQLDGYRQELRQLRQEKFKKRNIIVKSAIMRKVFDLSNKASEVDSTVLITGESGVGKEIVATHIHEMSSRHDKPFIKINCGAIPENLLESELFGYEKGAFTGASKSGKMGMFELANKGTLLLDEIGELPLSLQVKLLRVVQESELSRLGGIAPIKIDVRIIAATSRNLVDLIKTNQFREELYYRLNVVPIHIPPLRERKDDILPLVIFFIDKFNSQYKKQKYLKSKEVMRYIENYCWPGNVRELQNVVERMFVLSETDAIETQDIPDCLFVETKKTDSVEVTDIIPLKQALELTESKLIALAKKKYGTTMRIAKYLGVNQSTISRKMRKQGIR
jgi:PAS domain S-box-containing protein